MDIRNAQAKADAGHGISFGEAFGVWLRVDAGGAAGVALRMVGAI